MPCCFLVVDAAEQYIVSDFTSKEIVNGPNAFYCIKPWSGVEKFHLINLRINEYCIVRDKMNPEKDRHEFGPQNLRLTNPYEYIENLICSSYGSQHIKQCPILDQDDYITVCHSNGEKENYKGPLVYKPQLNDIISESMNTVQVPVNCYLKVNDSNNPSEPVLHLRGPLKFYPTAFQTIIKNMDGGSITTGAPLNSTPKKSFINVFAGPDKKVVVSNLDYFPCIEVTKNSAVHLRQLDGNVVMLDTPQFYMPAVGESVFAVVTKNVLIQTDFCILKAPDGTIHVMNGRCEADRSFFLRPFYEFLTFNCGTIKNILSTLPSFMPHNFNIRTSDNVVMSIDVRISYQIQDVDVFSSNPIDFYPFIKNHVQNDLLDRFSQSNLREFMLQFSRVAQESVVACNDYFNKFGISILDVQILCYTCLEQKTQELLNQDIHTNVNKQNELRARQNDILIQEQSNEVQRKQKDLEVQMAMKDSEVAMQRKIMGNAIRLKEMEIQISEEQRRTELLELKRGNDLIEAEFEGKARGAKLREFLVAIDPALSQDQKIAVWAREQDLIVSKKLYAKVDSISMYPPQCDMKMYNFNDSAAATDGNAAGKAAYIKEGLMIGVGVEEVKSKKSIQSK